MAEPTQTDVEKMCDRVMWLLVHEISPVIHPEITEWDKDTVWREASSIIWPHFGPHLKDTVFEMLVKRGDIEDLGTRIRITPHITPQGVMIPVILLILTVEEPVAAVLTVHCKLVILPAG